jgi:hypothetical protein
LKKEFYGVVDHFLHTDGFVSSICLERRCTDWCELRALLESDVSAQRRFSTKALQPDGK